MDEPQNVGPLPDIGLDSSMRLHCTKTVELLEKTNHGDGTRYFFEPVFYLGDRRTNPTDYELYPEFVSYVNGTLDRANESRQRRAEAGANSSRRGGNTNNRDGRVQPDPAKRGVSDNRRSDLSEQCKEYIRQRDLRHELHSTWKVDERYAAARNSDEVYHGPFILALANHAHYAGTSNVCHACGRAGKQPVPSPIPKEVFISQPFRKLIRIDPNTGDVALGGTKYLSRQSLKVLRDVVERYPGTDSAAEAAGFLKLTSQHLLTIRGNTQTFFESILTSVPTNGHVECPAVWSMLQILRELSGEGVFPYGTGRDARGFTVTRVYGSGISAPLMVAPLLVSIAHIAMANLAGSYDCKADVEAAVRTNVRCYLHEDGYFGGILKAKKFRDYLGNYLVGGKVLPSMGVSEAGNIIGMTVPYWRTKLPKPQLEEFEAMLSQWPEFKSRINRRCDSLIHAHRARFVMNNILMFPVYIWTAVPLMMEKGQYASVKTIVKNPLVTLSLDGAPMQFKDAEGATTVADMRPVFDELKDQFAGVEWDPEFISFLTPNSAGSLGSEYKAAILREGNSLIRKVAGTKVGAMAMFPEMLMDIDKYYEEYSTICEMTGRVQIERRPRGVWNVGLPTQTAALPGFLALKMLAKTVPQIAVGKATGDIADMARGLWATSQPGICSSPNDAESYDGTISSGVRDMFKGETSYATRYSDAPYFWAVPGEAEFYDGTNILRGICSAPMKIYSVRRNFPAMTHYTDRTFNVVCDATNQCFSSGGNDTTYIGTCGTVAVGMGVKNEMARPGILSDRIIREMRPDFKEDDVTPLGVEKYGAPREGRHMDFGAFGDDLDGWVDVRGLDPEGLMEMGQYYNALVNAKGKDIGLSYAYAWSNIETVFLQQVSFMGCVMPNLPRLSYLEERHKVTNALSDSGKLISMMNEMMGRSAFPLGYAKLGFMWLTSSFVLTIGDNACRDAANVSWSPIRNTRLLHMPFFLPLMPKYGAIPCPEFHGEWAIPKAPDDQLCGKGAIYHLMRIMYRLNREFIEYGPFEFVEDAAGGSEERTHATLQDVMSKKNARIMDWDRMIVYGTYNHRSGISHRRLEDPSVQFALRASELLDQYKNQTRLATAHQARMQLDAMDVTVPKSLSIIHYEKSKMEQLISQYDFVDSEYTEFQKGIAALWDGKIRYKQLLPEMALFDVHYYVMDGDDVVPSNCAKVMLESPIIPCATLSDDYRRSFMREGHSDLHSIETLGYLNHAAGGTYLRDQKDAIMALARAIISTDEPHRALQLAKQVLNLNDKGKQALDKLVRSRTMASSQAMPIEYTPRRLPWQKIGPDAVDLTCRIIGLSSNPSIQAVQYSVSAYMSRDLSSLLGPKRLTIVFDNRWRSNAGRIVAIRGREQS